MEAYKLRKCPLSQEMINTLKDLDLFFDKLIDRGIDIKDIFCYVTLDFVQHYYLKHLHETPTDRYRVYNFDVLNIPYVPGVYRVTAINGVNNRHY